MPLDPAVVVSAIFNVMLTLVIALVSWWARQIADEAKKARDEAQAARAHAERAHAALAEHKLFAAETYVRETDLTRLRTELIGHFERLERLVTSAISPRGHPPAE